jgi:WD40 repeat protein
VQAIREFERDNGVLDLLATCARNGKRTGLRAAWQARVFQGHKDWITSVCFSEDGRFAFSASLDKSVVQWELLSGRPIRQFEGHREKVNAVSVSGVSGHACSAGDDKTLRLWNVATGAEVRRFGERAGEAAAVTLLPGGR